MNKKIMLILLLCICFFPYHRIFAEECTTKELATLKQLAKNIKVNYELYDATYNENHTYYFNVILNNFSNKFYILDSDGQEFRYMETLEKDGVRKLRAVKEGTDYSLDIYATNETNCLDSKIITKRVSIPYFNDYSLKEECNGIEDFPLCQKYYNGYIESEEYFLKQVNKYKNGEKEENKEQNFFQVLISFITNNLIFIIPITIVLITSIVILIIKNKKRIKVRI